MKILTIIYLFLFTNVYSQNDNLVPVNGFFYNPKKDNQYELRINKFLLSKLENHPTIRILVIPSFTSEYVISIDNNILTYKIAKENISNSIQKENIEETTEWCTVDDDFSLLLKNVFVLITSKIQYPTKNMFGEDGTSYYFMTYSGNFLRSGYTWSPDPKSRLNELVELTNLLVDLAKNKFKDEQIKSKIREKCNKIIIDFNK